MALAFLLAAEGVDLAPNRANASVAALVAAGYLDAGSLRRTDDGETLAHLLTGLGKDFDRARQRMKAKGTGIRDQGTGD